MNLFCQLDVTVTVTPVTPTSDDGEGRRTGGGGGDGGADDATLKDSSGGKIDDGDGDDSEDDDGLLPVIFLERSTEDETGKSGAAAATTPTTVFDLNKPLAPSPPPPSPTSSNSSSENNSKPDFALSVLHEIFKLLIASKTTTSKSTGTGDDDDDELRTRLGPLWKFRRSKRSSSMEVKCVARSPPPGSGPPRPPPPMHRSQLLLLPIQKGVSSSTAFVISWILVLSELVEGPQKQTLQDLFFTKQPILLARLAHRAEVTHFTGAPGGTMDHITIACCCRCRNNNNNGTSEGEDGNSSISCPGGLVRIGGRGGDPWHVEHFRMMTTNDAATASTDNEASNNNKKRKCDDSTDDNDLDDMWGGWILADSGQPKDTFGHLHRCKNTRLELLHKKLNGDWDYSSGGKNDDDKDDEGDDGGRNDDEKTEREKSSKTLTDDERVLWTTTIDNRSYEEQAAKIFRRYQDKHRNRTDNETERFDDDDDESQFSPGQQLGHLMLKHHEALAGGLNLSTDRIERMKVAAMQAGAWGFKLVGSGGGGCTVAWGPKSKVSDIASAIRLVAPDEIQTWSMAGTGDGTGGTEHSGPHIIYNPTFAD
eukprot:CAMPEP_0113459566 /NCGR_PEP_ID=MMETSP0014_2-20120614/10521_1 /TAXON_ID=2857 /ORGANISM="Nitzschia sp." /LENGTH=592 /DNA_ID=CAMNT_0000351159 /DNA_START=312 /DNA_END=2090 /DNA_ORIENTATION=- /assembly_acc=CAM_ASM_000159